MKKNKLILMITFILTIILLLSNAYSATITLHFGINSTDSPTVVGQKFIPVIKSIEKRMIELLKQPVLIEFKIFRTYNETISAIINGKVDFVRLGPASYIIAKRKNPNIRLLAMGNRNGKKTFKGLIIIHKDSPIKKLSELKGKTFAFGNKISTIGRYLSQVELYKAGICAKDLSRFDYLERHDNVFSAVAMKKYDAGAIKESTFIKRNKKIEKTKILHSFPNVTKPWIAREGLNDNIFNALRITFLTMKDLKVLKKLKSLGFFPTSHEEYKFVEEAMTRVDEFNNCNNEKTQ